MEIYLLRQGLSQIQSGVSGLNLVDDKSGECSPRLFSIVAEDLCRAEARTARSFTPASPPGVH